jgi:tetratricopeptide (TPR) repeat protein
VIFFFVTGRYRLPVVPFLILFAAYGLPLWISRARQRRWRELAVPGAVALLLGIVANTGLPGMPVLFNSDAYSDLGTSYYLRGDLVSAQRQYETALARDPGNTEAAHNLGAIALRQRRWDDAERLLRTVLQAYPDDENALMNLGNTAYFRGDPWLAGSFYTRVFRLNPRHPEINEHLRGVEGAAAQAEQDGLARDPEGLLQRLEGAFRGDPGNSFLFPRLVRLLESRGATERALAVVRQRLAASPDDAAAHEEERRLQEGSVSTTPAPARPAPGSR